jgi:hypothetical protein
VESGTASLITSAPLVGTELTVVAIIMIHKGTFFNNEMLNVTFFNN